jgi:hypothetical protein
MYELVCTLEKNRVWVLQWHWHPLSTSHVFSPQTYVRVHKSEYLCKDKQEYTDYRPTVGEHANGNTGL